MSEPATSSQRSKITLLRVTVAYALLLIVLLAALEWGAEWWLPLAILTFAPPPALLMPLVLLLPLALWKRSGAAMAVQLACAALVLFGFMTFRFLPPSKPDGGITVITHNVGQAGRDAFANSFPGVRPDAILLQDVRGAGTRQRDYMARYPAYRAATVDPQFVLLTPHAVESSKPVREALWHGRSIAARFVLDIKGDKIAIYSVHLPTPRRSLAHVFTTRALLEMFWVGRAPTDEFPSYRHWLEARLLLARQLAAAFEKEKLPFLIGGDFNMPDHGIVYHTFASRFTDAHAVAGRGWGMTFPGSREGGIPAMIGPWLRLDYWFAGRGLKPVQCRVADDDHSQHRAVLARFLPSH
jgi:endonuclease/exonuclease/phosphatase (EEP) superfamily protein YafD